MLYVYQLDILYKLLNQQNINRTLTKKDQEKIYAVNFE